MNYPKDPGWQGGDTSYAAAQDAKRSQGTIQESVLAALAHDDLASFELAARIGRSYRSVQPRTSELSQRTPDRPALICDSGFRRRDPETGKQAIVWRLIARDPIGENQ